MKKLIFLTILSLFLNCAKKEKEVVNPYFISNENYEKILQGVEELNNGNKYYYVFNYSDTIIITSTKGISGCIPCGGSKKKGSFDYKNKIIIITEPLSPKTNIIKSPNALSKDNKISMIDTKVPIERHPEGIIYKLNDKYNMEKVYKGDLSKYLNKEEYQLHPKNY